jgi:hypothetical protein
VVGWLLGWAGFALGVLLTRRRYSLHQRLGVAIQILGTLQVIIGDFSSAPAAAET